MENIESNNELQVIIAYHKILAEEIQRRSRNQMFCVTASIVAIGTLITIFLSQFPNYSFIIAGVPWILAAFGVIWLDHHFIITMIGRYLREDEEKNIPQLLGALPQEIKWLGWEVYLRKNLNEYFKSMNKSQKNIMDFVVFFPVFYFIIPALFSCIYFIYLCCYSNIMLPTVIEISFILIDLFCVLILLLYLHRAIKKIHFKSLTELIII